MMKQGRPRSYDDASALNMPALEAGAFACADVCRFACGLHELRLRVVDQIEDLPDSAFAFPAPKSSMTIGWLVTHLVFAEAMWLRILRKSSKQTEVEDSVRWATSSAYVRQLPEVVSAGEITALYDRIETEVTLPTLVRLEALDVPTGDERLPTVEKVLTHLLWHWTYHSGQIGLIRLQWGSDYEWRF